MTLDEFATIKPGEWIAQEGFDYSFKTATTLATLLVSERLEAAVTIIRNFLASACQAHLAPTFGATARSRVCRQAGH